MPTFTASTIQKGEHIYTVGDAIEGALFSTSDQGTEVSLLSDPNPDAIIFRQFVAAVGQPEYWGVSGFAEPNLGPLLPGVSVSMEPTRCMVNGQILEPGTVIELNRLHIIIS